MLKTSVAKMKRRQHIDSDKDRASWEKPGDCQSEDGQAFRRRLAKWPARMDEEELVG